jgi:hypothetical protein
MKNLNGLTVTENEDSSFTLEWDENDPRYSILNGLSEEQITEMITQELQKIIDSEEDQ